MSSGAATPQAAVSIEERIAERIRAFDVPALLDVLSAAGYRDDEIEYRSHATTVHRGNLVHAIEFHRAPARRVIITVNLGLLSLQTPLPSFFLKAMETLGDEAMSDFIGFFDHQLLKARFAGLYPERDESLVPGWGRTAGDRLRLLRLASPSSVHWLFQKTYPELEVRVRRATTKQRVPTQGIRLGAAALGDGTAVGGFAAVPVGGLEVRLYADDVRCGTGAPWAIEAERRFDAQLVPLLAETGLPLTLVLTLRDAVGWARLAATTHLGYDPLVSQEEHAQDVIIHSGDLAARARSHI